MRFDVFSVVVLVGAAQGLFLALLLAARRRQGPAQSLLATLMAVYSWGIAAVAMERSQIYAEWPHLVGTATALPFLYGPLHYLYARYLTRGTRRVAPRDAWHLLPFAAYTLYLVPFYLRSAGYKRAFLEAMHAGQGPVVLEVAAVLKALHGLVYVGATLVLLHRYRQTSRAGAARLAWLWQITLLTAGVWGLNAVLMIGSRAGVVAPGGVDLAVGVATAVALYAFGYLGLRHAGSGLGASPKGRVTSEKYERSGLAPERAEEYEVRLRRALETEQAYRRAGLTLQDLAAEIDVSPNHLSQVINDRLGQNFSELVNGYRVEAAQKRLIEPETARWTILAVAYDVGFNSKSAFNAAFKKVTGMTPSQYKKRHPAGEERSVDR